MSLSSSLWTAILADLRGVSVANGYELDVAKVYEGAEPDPQQRLSPSIAVRIGSFDSEADSLGNRSGEARQEFILKLMVAESDSRTVLLQLLDSTRDALEKSTSQLMSVAANADVLDIELAFDSGESYESVAPGWIEMDGVARVVYPYGRGSA